MVVVEGNAPHYRDGNDDRRSSGVPCLPAAGLEKEQEQEEWKEEE